MDVFPHTLDLLPDASFFKGRSAVLAIGGNTLHHSYIGNDCSVTQQS